MPYIYFEGQYRYVPGVYHTTRVVSSIPGPLPALHIPVLLAHGFEGTPYDVDSKQVTGETALGPLRLCRTESAVASLFGAESDAHRAMRFAKRHGLPFAYVGCLSDMVRASVVVDDGGGTPVEQFTLYPRTWGPKGGHPRITWDGTNWSTTPVKRYALLDANAGASATRLYLKGDHPWLTVGASIVVAANDVAGVTRTVTNAGIEIGADGQRDYWIEISSAAGSALNTSAYALVLQYDTAKVETSPAVDCQALIDWINSTSIHWFAVKHANFDNTDPANVTGKALKEITEWGTVTVGTCPAMTGTDVDGFVSLMNAGGWAKFAVQTGTLPHTYMLASDASANHGKMRDYATAERERGYPIAVVVGCGWGDVVLDAGDDTDPLYRVAALNSQDVMLCAGGIDREAAAISTAAAIWGRRVEGGVGHNLTNDELIHSEREGEWDEINSGELSALARRGVVTYKLSLGQTYRYRVSQGSSTLQANAVIWNVADATTWAVHQRDLMDAVVKAVVTDLEELAIGSDRIYRDGVGQMLFRRGSTLERTGWVKPDGLQVNDITLNDAGNGYDVDWGVKLPDLVDFIAMTNNVMVGV